MWGVTAQVHSAFAITEEVCREVSHFDEYPFGSKARQHSVFIESSAVAWGKIAERQCSAFDRSDPSCLYRYCRQRVSFPHSQHSSVPVLERQPRRGTAIADRECPFLIHSIARYQFWSVSPDVVQLLQTESVLSSPTA